MQGRGKIDEFEVVEFESARDDGKGLGDQSAVRWGRGQIDHFKGDQLCDDEHGKYDNDESDADCPKNSGVSGPLEKVQLQSHAADQNTGANKPDWLKIKVVKLSVVRNAADEM